MSGSSISRAELLCYPTEMIAMSIKSYLGGILLKLLYLLLFQARCIKKPAALRFVPCRLRAHPVPCTQSGAVRSINLQSIITLLISRAGESSPEVLACVVHPALACGRGIMRPFRPSIPPSKVLERRFADLPWRQRLLPLNPTISL